MSLGWAEEHFEGALLGGDAGVGAQFSVAYLDYL